MESRTCLLQLRLKASPKFSNRETQFLYYLSSVPRESKLPDYNAAPPSDSAGFTACLLLFSLADPPQSTAGNPSSTFWEGAPLSRTNFPTGPREEKHPELCFPSVPTADRSCSRSGLGRPPNSWPSFAESSSHYWTCSVTEPLQLCHQVGAGGSCQGLLHGRAQVMETVHLPC